MAAPTHFNNTVHSLSTATTEEQVAVTPRNAVVDSDPANETRSWDKLMPRPVGRNEPFLLGAQATTALGQSPELSLHIGDDWLAMQRGRYNDEGDALLRTMLSVFQHGSPEANRSCSFDPQTRLLQFDFLHRSQTYTARAIVDAAGKISDIRITNAQSPARCLHLSEKKDDSSSGACYRRLPQRASSSSALYRLLNTDSAPVANLEGERADASSATAAQVPSIGGGSLNSTSGNEGESDIGNAMTGAMMPVLRYVIDPDHIYRRMEGPNPDSPRILRELARKARQDKQDAARRKARAAGRRAQLAEDQGEQEEEGREQQKEKKTQDDTDN